jgi:hypothetical protein
VQDGVEQPDPQPGEGDEGQPGLELRGQAHPARQPTDG